MFTVEHEQSGMSALLRSRAATSSIHSGKSARTPSELGCLILGMRKTMLVAGCALILGSTAMADDDAMGRPYFMRPQRDLISNLKGVLREQNELERCREQQQQALQRFLALGLSYNAAALMAHEQYPCD